MARCPLERLRVGDTVYSWDFDSGSVQIGQVTAVLHGGEREIISIHTSRETLRCSGEHRFFIPKRGWIAASAIIPGDEVHTKDASLIRVIDVGCIAHEDVVPTYNVDVEPFHNFLVGEEKVLVHNREILK